MNTSTVASPSLFNSADTSTAALSAGSAAASPREARTLSDLMYDGFYLLFLLKGKQSPSDAESFSRSVKEFLTHVERDAVRLGCDAKDIHLCKYAFCATVDEIVLMSQFRIRDVWMQRPLQLQFFGDQLAGERFFDHLEELRREGSTRTQVLEVFHMCLLLGFQGKYILDGSEKLAYLTSRLGDDIAHLKGSRPLFAPHALPPDRIVHRLKNDVPLWVFGSVFGLLSLLAYVGIRWHLQSGAEQQLAGFEHVVRLAPPAANVTITLP